MNPINKIHTQLTDFAPNTEAKNLEIDKNSLNEKGKIAAEHVEANLGGNEIKKNIKSEVHRKVNSENFANNLSATPTKSRIPKDASPPPAVGNAVQSRIPKNTVPMPDAVNAVKSRVPKDTDSASLGSNAVASIMPEAIISEVGINLAKTFGLTEDEHTKFTSNFGDEAINLKKEYDLSDREITAIRIYTNNDYFPKINNQFRNLPLDKVDITNSQELCSAGVTDACLAEIIVSLVSGMKKLPPAHLDDAYIQGLGRMVNLRGDLDSYQEGVEITTHSFTSSSISTMELTGENWWNIKSHMAVIRQRVGGNGRDISAFSEYPGEKEICFLPNTLFKILYRSEEVDTPPGYSVENREMAVDYNENTEKFRKKIFIVMQEIGSV
jgi:hypothetical protein